MLDRDSTDPDVVRFGTSSFSSKDWVGPFYPEGTSPGEFIRHYATEFDTVEVDATYYAIPAVRNIEAWVRKTPDRFRFAAKFPRSIVHGGQGATPDKAVILAPDKTYADRDRFLAVMSGLGDRLGPLLLQFPYFARRVFGSRDDFFERLDRFMADLPDGFRYAIEIRNRAWLGEALVDLCKQYRAALVMVDQAWMPMADELARKLDPVTTDFTYVRLLGDRREIEAITKTWDREVIDRSERLERWAGFLADMLHRHVPTVVYINNHYAGHAPTTARRLRDLFRQRAGITGRRD